MATYHDILEQLTTAVAVVAAVVESGPGANFRVTYLNQSAQALFGLSASRAVGQSLGALVADDHASARVLQSVLATGAPFTKREVALRVAPGSARVNYSISPLSDNELLVEFERVDRIIRIDKDERHASLQETVRKLARGLAHEIKNPLGGIRGAAQLLERQLADNEREYTSIIMAEADRLRNLVDRILGPSNLPTFGKVNIHHVIERVVALAQAQSQTAVAFVRDYDPSVPEIDADFEQLVQATLNVVNNAMVALDEVPDATIRLRTRVVRQFTIGATRHRLVVNMDCIDNGPGVPADIAPRIFYPMISGRPDGSGLGLAITQTILARHNGLVECESERGRTVFSFYLPVRQSPAMATANGPDGQAREDERNGA